MGTVVVAGGITAEAGGSKMPGGNGRGPRGMGPGTGRGLGYCVGHGRPGYLSGSPAMGWGRGFGGGFARGYRGNQNLDPDFAEPVEQPSMGILNDHLSDLDTRLAALEKRISEWLDQQG